MMLLGSSSPKPTDLYSNGSWISGLNMGPLTKDFKQKNTTLQTTRQSLSNYICMDSDGIHIQYKKSSFIVQWPPGRYVNKDGVQKFTGTSGLKLSASRS